MKIVPQFTADFDEYPELRTLADAALRRVVELMSIHAIVELKRLRKTGVFDHPYVKDVVTPLEIPVVPNTVRAARYAAGKAMLDYLEAIGISSVQLEITQEDVQAIATLWVPPSEVPPEAPKDDAGSLDPVPADEIVAPPVEEDPKPKDEAGGKAELIERDEPGEAELIRRPEPVRPHKPNPKKQEA